MVSCTAQSLVAAYCCSPRFASLTTVGAGSKNHCSRRRLVCVVSLFAAALATHRAKPCGYTAAKYVADINDVRLTVVRHSQEDQSKPSPRACYHLSFHSNLDAIVA